MKRSKISMKKLRNDPVIQLLSLIFTPIGLYMIIIIASELIK